MFESIKHWIDDAHQHAKLFDHADDEVLHVGLASLLYRVISADNKETGAEKREFAHILKHEFDLNDAQIAAIHERVKSISCDLEDDLKTIAEYLKHKPGAKLNFMKMLNHLVSVDGVSEAELGVFYQAQKFLFPELDNDGF